MVAYVELLPDSKILSSVTGFESVLILGCRGCANACIAYQKNLPCDKLLTDKKTNIRKRSAYAIVKESNRIKNLLESIKIEANVKVWKCPAWDLFIPSSGVRSLFPYEELIKTCSNADAVVTLCCSSGTLGVKKALGKSFKVIPGMKTLGWVYFHFIVDESGQFVLIDKDESVITKLVR